MTITIIVAIIAIIHEIYRWHNALISHDWHSTPTAIYTIWSKTFYVSNWWWLWNALMLYFKVSLFMYGVLYWITI